VQIGGGIVHLFFEIAKNGFAVAVEKAREIFDVLVVGIPRNLSGARGCALLDGMEKAGAKEAALIVGLADFEMAGAEFEGFLQMGDCVFELMDAGEWAVEFDAFGAGGAGDVYAWEFVIERDHEIRIGFAIDEAGVVFGVKVFDEAIFGQ